VERERVSFGMTLEGGSHGRPPSPRKAAGAVFLVSLLIATVFILVHPAPAFHGDMITYEGIAKNIVAGKWHFGWGEEPSAHREPLYPLFVAGIYKVFGPSRGAVHYAQALLFAGTCGLLVLLAARLLRSRAAAVLAGLLAAVYPPFLLQIQTVLTEPLATALLLLAMYFVVVGWTEGRRGAILLGGLTLGLATLTRAANLSYAPALAVAMVISGSARRRIGAATAVAFLAVFVAVLSPWTARNYAVFHRFIPVGVNAGGSFFRGNYDEGTLGSMGSNYDPRMPPQITSKYKGLDEVDIDRLLMREGLDYVRSHPGTFAKLCALKLARFWLNLGFASPPSRASIAFAVMNGALLALALFGIFGSGLVEARAAIPVHVLVVYYTVLHALLFATARYDMPVMPYVLAFAAAGALGAARRAMPGALPSALLEGGR
jgi:4-amino-4-deoxy-L-arabinose transferase-like glycosyltransferase